jgi:hypothetical protein
MRACAYLDVLSQFGSSSLPFRVGFVGRRLLDGRSYLLHYAACHYTLAFSGAEHQKAVLSGMRSVPLAASFLPSLLPHPLGVQRKKSKQRIFGLDVGFLRRASIAV